jgi:sulfur-oxidizing protein SoxY
MRRELKPQCGHDHKQGRTTAGLAAAEHFELARQGAMSKQAASSPTRRGLLKAAGALAAGAGIGAAPTPGPAAATQSTMAAAIRAVVGDNRVNKGKVKLDIPPLVENGNTVPCSVSVDSLMTPANHVRAIHVFNEKNPQPNVIGVHLGPRAGRASISTRIRLAASQKVLAIAELSDGSFWSDSVDVVITLGACLEDS